MNEAINMMLQKYNCKSLEDYENALTEISQEIALSGLARSDFFSHAAFYGGSALRIFYHLPRFSEDLDFSLDSPDENYDISTYLNGVERELNAYDLIMTVKKKSKTKECAVQSAFIKGNTIQNVLEIALGEDIIAGVDPKAVLKIKLEVDTNPPDGAGYQIINALSPAPHQVKLYDIESLFAGKIHAVLCRNYKNRVKGRDFYDYIWYLQRNTKVNIHHLQKRMEQSGRWNPEEQLTFAKMKKLLLERFESIDYDSAREDVARFLSNGDRSNLSLWNADFFIDITKRSLCE
jgi:predicted nucleotidyltransferase component of viral defense system